MPAIDDAEDCADAAACAAGAFRGVPDFPAASTSALTIRPRGPEPCSAEISIAAFWARRFASGDAKTRPLGATVPSSVLLSGTAGILPAIGAAAPWPFG